MKITRRSLIFGSMAAAATGVLAKFIPKSGFLSAYGKVSGNIIGASAKIGHKLRSGNFPEPTSTTLQDVVIIGSGISGLAAGYQLHKSGFNNFTILELEKEAGGNSRSGKNNISRYPWGAHYVPLLSEEATEVQKLFTELGIITGYSVDGLPIYNEFYIAQDPDERLYLYGRWQDGLVPAIGINKTDESEYKRFFAMMEHYKTLKGSDGKKVFAIPVDRSSQDSKHLELDKMTMLAWLQNNDFKSEHLLWYVNYCCRDDYGTTSAESSAWAGIHYFAARNGKAANTDSKNVITWPEGNGWLANKLAEPIKDNIVTIALTYKITNDNKNVNIEYWDEATGQSKRITAKAVIIATPRFITSRLVPGKYKADGFSYASWMVANISLSKLPEGRGRELSWDNVIYRSNMLGYVVATHQNLDMRPLKTVITYYWPLSHTSPENARREALTRSIDDWQEIVLEELLSIHPELEGHIENVDVCVWGHAMVRPTVGFIWGENRKGALKQHPPIFTAHSDMSGISIFEEAYTHGVKTASQVLSFLGYSRKANI